MENEQTLDEIVNFYLDAWELPDGQYRRIHSLAVRGYREIYKHASGEPQCIELEVLANKTTELPCDCLNKISVGVLNAKGEIATLTEDESLGLGGATSPNRLSEPTQKTQIDDNSEIFYNVNGNYLGNYLYAQMGVGARSDLGFFKIDWKQRLIIYDFQFPYANVWLTYLPVYSNDGKYVVNPFFSECLINFIGWQDKRRTAQDRRDCRFEYFNELRIGKRSMKAFDPTQAQNQSARTTRIARW
jgi:hypothetical protein